MLLQTLDSVFVIAIRHCSCPVSSSSVHILWYRDTHTHMITERRAPTCSLDDIESIPQSNLTTISSNNNNGNANSNETLVSSLVSAMHDDGASKGTTDQEDMRPNINRLAVCVAVAMLCFVLPKPDSLAIEAWKLLAIFIGPILAIMLKPLPMGAVCMVGLTTCVITNAVSLNSALQMFGNDVVWLILVCGSAQALKP
jgi:hypothetical protein